MLKQPKVRQGYKAQVIIEFTFCMIIVLFMVYSIAVIAFWTGKDLVDRRRAHDDKLTQGVTEGYADPRDGPLKQLDPYFFSSRQMNATWSGH